MKIIIGCILFLSGIHSLTAQTVFGKWKTLNNETGKTESIVEVYKKDGKAYAKIVEIVDVKRKNDVCEACKGKNKNKPILGMIILNGLEKKGDEWSNGKILDPNNGKYYKCYISLVNDTKLKIRGYIGISLIGRTEYWYRDTN